MREADREKNKETQIRVNRKDKDLSITLCMSGMWFPQDDIIHKDLQHLHLSVPTSSVTVTLLPKSLMISNWFRGNAVLSQRKC